MSIYRNYSMVLATIILFTGLASPVLGQTDGLGNPIGHIRVNLNRETGLFSWRKYNGASYFVVRYRKCNQHTHDVLLQGGHHTSFQVPDYSSNVGLDISVFAYGFFDEGDYQPTEDARLLNTGHAGNPVYCDLSQNAPDFDDREEGEIRIPIDNPDLHPIHENAPQPVPPTHPSGQPVGPNPVPVVDSPPVSVPGDQHRPSSGGLTVTLNVDYGKISWTAVPGATVYMVFWERCNHPKHQLPVIGFTEILIPNFVANERYDIRVDAMSGSGAGQEVIAWNYVTNNFPCSSQPSPGNIIVFPTVAFVPPEEGQPAPTPAPSTIKYLVSEPRPREISWHAGTTLKVSTEGGNITVIDVGRKSSLAVAGICIPGQTLAANADLMVSCTSDGRFYVLQVNPQHAGDRRRDLLVFDATLTNCFRAYEYLDTGVVEIFYRKC